MRPMIAPQLLAWWDKHGRKNLPWQRQRNPYRVWVAEIMLQQTQAATVKRYYPRFIDAFPNIRALAEANEDAVLAVWAGLGYYSRAHNLMKVAGIVVERHGGELPEEYDELVALPGIGRSTAAAILAQAHGKRHAILDGNARRVLARLHAVEGWPGKSAVARKLWDMAEAHTPAERVRDYTQAIMDLGATVCMPRKPRCGSCPLGADCQARIQGRTAGIPSSRPVRRRALRHCTMALVRRPDGAVLLERRPPRGIWAGLWCLPTLNEGEDAQAWCAKALNGSATLLSELPPIRHGFTHFELEIRPIQIELAGAVNEIRETDPWLWHDGAQPLGVPAPIRRLLDAVQGSGPSPRASDPHIAAPR